MDDESGHPKLAQQDQVMKAFTENTNARVAPNSQRLSNIRQSSTTSVVRRLGLCVETNRGRDGSRKDVIDLLRNCFCWRCSRRGLCRNGHRANPGLISMLREMAYAAAFQSGVCNAETAMDNEKNPEWESHLERLVSKSVQVTARSTTLGSTGLSAPR